MMYPSTQILSLIEKISEAWSGRRTYGAARSNVVNLGKGIIFVGEKASQVKSLGQLIYDMFECLTTSAELENIYGAIKELEPIFGKNQET